MADLSGIGTSLVLQDKFTSVLKTVDRTINQTTRTMDRFEEATTGPARALNRLGDVASSAVDKLNSYIRTGMSRAVDIVQSSTERILGFFGNFGNRISERLGLSRITNKFTETFGEVRSKVSSALSRVNSSFRNAVSKLTSSASNMGRNINNNFKKVVDSIRNGFNNIRNFMKRTSNAFRQFGNEVSSAFGKFRGAANNTANVFRNVLGALGAYQVLGAIQNGVTGIVTELNSSTKAWGTFRSNMEMLGKSTSEIETVQSSLQEFATQTIYSASDMASTYSQMAAIGVKDTERLVKGMGGLAASAENPAQAMKSLSQQMTQAMSRPTIQWQDFRIMLEQAPAGMASVAKDMGYSMDELVLAVQDGTVSSEEFADSIAKVGTSADFTEMATEFKTIGQAVEGLTEGLSNKLMPLWDIVNETGIRAVEALSGAVDGMSFDSLIDGAQSFADSLDFEQILSNIGDTVGNVADKATEFYNAFKDTGAISAASDAFDSLGDAFGHVFENIDYADIGTSVGNVVTVFSDVATAVGDFISDIDPNVLDKATDAVIMAVGALGAIKVGSGVSSLVGLFGNLGRAVGNFGSNIGGAFGSLFGGGKKKTPTIDSPLDKMAESATQTSSKASKFDWGSAFSPMINNLSNFAKHAGNLALVWGAIELIGQLADAMKQIDDKVPSDLSTLAPKLLNMGIGLGAMAGVVTVASRLTRTNPMQAVKGLAAVAGLSANLMIAAEAMEQVNDKVTGNIGEFATKMANIAIGIGGMGVLVGAVGFFTSLNPIGAVGGLAVVAGISGNIMIAAEAMEQLNDKVSPNIGEIASKMGSIAVAMGSMGLIVGAVGALMATGIGAVVAGGGLLAVALIAGEIMLVSEAMKQLDEKVPEDMSSVEKKIENIASTIQAFNDANLGSVLDVFGNTVGVINTTVVSEGIDKFIDISDKMTTFSTIEIPPNVETKVNEIETAISAFSKSSFEDVIDNLITAADMSLVSGTINTFVDISENLQQLAVAQINSEMTKTNIDKIKDVVENLGTSKLGSIFSNMIEAGTMSTAKSSINAMNDLVPPVNLLANTVLNSEGAINNIDKIKTVIEKLGTATLKDLFGSLIKAGQMSNVSTIVDEMIQVRNRLNAFSHVSINVEDITKSIDDISTAINKLSEDSFGDPIGSMIGIEPLLNVSGTVDVLIELRQKFNQLGAIKLNMEGITLAVDNIKQSISLLNDFPTATGTEGINAIVDSVIRAADQLNNLTTVASVSATGVTTSLSSISTGFKSMSTTVKVQLDTMNSAVNLSMSSMRTSINVGMASSNVALSRGTNQMVTTVNLLRSRMYSAGYFAMSGLTAGIRAGSGSAISAARSVANSVSSTIQNALDIHSPSRVMLAFGRFISEGLADGILAGRQLVSQASQKLANAVVPVEVKSGTPAPLSPESGPSGGSIHINDDDLDDMRMNAGQTITVKNKQITPQVEIKVTNTSDEPVDTDNLLSRFEQKLIELMDSDLD